MKEGSLIKVMNNKTFRGVESKKENGSDESND